MATHTERDVERRGNTLRWAVWGCAVALLLLPLVAMRFTRDVQWTGSDFAVFGTMLFVACGAFDLATRRATNTAYRAGAGIALLAAFLLVWITLAVGILGDEHDPANLMFGGVLLVALVGAVVARFRPYGMRRAMSLTRFAQLSVFVIAGFAGHHDMRAVFPLTVMFMAMWWASSWCFGKAARV